MDHLYDFPGRDVLYYPLDPAKKQIRVLEILPTDDPSAELECNLRIDSLRLGCPKRALSYVWGALSDLRHIRVRSFTGGRSSKRVTVPIMSKLLESLRQWALIRKGFIVRNKDWAHRHGATDGSKWRSRIHLWIQKDAFLIRPSGMVEGREVYALKGFCYVRDILDGEAVKAESLLRFGHEDARDELFDNDIVLV